MLFMCTWRYIMAEKENTIVQSYRIAESLKAQLDEIAKAEHLTANALFTKLIRAYATCEFKTTDYGKAMENDLESWALHSAALQQLYETAIRNGMDAKESVRQELSSRILASEEAVSGLKEKLSASEEREKSAVDKVKNIENALQAALEEADKANEMAKKAEENAEAWKNSINTLTEQVDLYKEKAAAYDKLLDEVNSLKVELATSKKIADVQQQMIDQYMSGK